jgi:hypothetical protein
MLIWDNQQATNYFIGILEGEGNFIDRSSGYKAVEIQNNDLDIIDACEYFLKLNAILYNVYPVKAGRKTGYRIIISKQDCINLYTRINSQLECRLQEYQRILGASETERDLTVNRDWLVAIYEAEGSFILSENYRGNITPKIELDNTNEKIINKIVKTLYSLQCSWYVKDYDRGKKPFTKITIQGIKRCKRFLTIINTWRSNKINQKCKLILDYCNIRLSKTANSPYDQEERNIKLQFASINS